MKDFFDEHADHSLMYHDYPEHGPGAIGVEEMYEAFKARMMGEMFGGAALDGCWAVSKKDGETIVLDFGSEKDADSALLFLRSVTNS